jgi:hypothetical protein
MRFFITLCIFIFRWAVIALALYAAIHGNIVNVILSGAMLTLMSPAPKF